jgi:hypothetical protein
MPNLYAVFLGGRHAGSRFAEAHEVVFVVAENPGEARTQAKAKWGGENRENLHIDSLAEVNRVDGHAVRLEPSSAGDDIVIDPKYSP